MCALSITVGKCGGEFCHNLPPHFIDEKGEAKRSELSEATGTKLASRVCAPNSQATLSITFLGLSIEV